MIAVPRPAPQPASPEWHERFVAMLPVIVAFARRSFRGLPPEAMEDAMAEVLASTAIAYARLVEQGKESLAYPTVLAGFAVRRYRDGRGVAKSRSPKDIFSRHAQPEGKFSLQQMGNAQEQRYWLEHVACDTRTPVPDQVAFRIDFQDWLQTLSARDRRIVEELGTGETTGDVAKKHRVSSARISQLRRELKQAWEAFVRDPAECDLVGAM